MKNIELASKDFSKKAEVLAQMLKKKGIKVSRPKISARGLKEAPLSFAQQRLWITDQILEHSQPVHNIHFALRLKGRLVISALEKSLESVVLRHEVLRARFRTSANGDPVQEVIPDWDVNLRMEDLTSFPEAEREAEAMHRIRHEAKHKFNLAAGEMLMRSLLLRLGDEEHIALLVLHHIISDGWSSGILIQELQRFYEAEIQGQKPQLKEMSLQYADYAVWHREFLEQDELERQTSYWKKELEEAPHTIDLPTDYPGGTPLTYAGATDSVAFGPGLTAEIKRLSRTESTTPFVILLAAFNVLLFRWTRQRDQVIGTPIANRNREETENLIGFFVNALALRSRVNQEDNFRCLVAQIHEMMLRAQAYQDLPFEKLVQELQPERDLSYTRLFNVTFSLQRNPDSLRQFPGLHISVIELGPETSEFDLTLVIAEGPHEFEATFTYKTDLFKAATIRRFAEYYRFLLEGIVANPDRKITELPLLGETERQKLLIDFNCTGYKYEQSDRNLVEMLTEAALKNHSNTAVVFGQQELTYEELDKQSNQVAHYLRRCGVGTEGRVGICMERSLEMVIGLLGILKSGAAYVPIDPGYPPDRIAYIVMDAGITVIVSENRFLEKLAICVGTRKVVLDFERAEIANESEAPVAAYIEPDNLAYLIYTSGSTGSPKAVMISHRSINNRLLWMQSAFPLSSQDSVLQKTVFSFDASVWEIFSPIINGARLVLARPQGEKDPAYLISAICDNQITVLQMVPSMLQVLVTEPGFEGCTSLKLVFCGGEPFPSSLQKEFQRRLPATLVNLYGPTEASIDATFYQLQELDETNTIVPIGQPITNMQVYLLGESLEPVVWGGIGELYLGGVGIARGYQNRPDLTAERFVPNPLGGPGSRLYRTGDLARLLDSGVLQFIGRADHQVKLRGYRIELEEVETAIRKHPLVQDTVVTLTEDKSGNQQLVAYTVLKILNSAKTTEFCCLPNGLYVSHINKLDTDLVYKEIFGNNCYLQHGIILRDGCCVFDVGANIGLFSLYVHDHWRDAHVYAFEPIPPLFSKLRDNMDFYSLNTKVFSCGLSNKRGNANFTFYPHLTTASGMYADAEEDRGVSTLLLANADEQLRPYHEELLEGRFESETFHCALTTLSEVIHQHNIKQIDLLKIDVEKSEQLVLEGINEEDWPKISQIVLEVHDLHGRLAEIVDVLDRHEFDAVIEQDQLLAGTALYNVYAVRRGAAEKAGLSVVSRDLLADTLNPESLDLRSYLRTKLPDYMVPGAFISLPQLPRLPNGKIDYRSLPHAETNDVASQKDKYIPPQSPVEQVVAGIWADVLGVDLVGRHDNFFALGGHSLRATQVISRIRSTFQRKIGLGTLFDGPTVAQLSKSIEQALGMNALSALPQVQRSSSKEGAPLSYAQERLWFLDQFQPGEATYNIAAGIRLHGKVTIGALQNSLQMVVKRHEALRTRFVLSESGHPVQQVVEDYELTFAVIDLSSLSDPEQQLEMGRWLELEAKEKFDLSTGPLVRVRLLKLREEEHVAVLVMHHIVSDGWSMAVLIRELGHFYKAELEKQTPELEELPFQYADYAIWQRQWLRDQIFEEQLSYWRAALAGAPTLLELPADHARPVVASHRGATETIHVGKGLSTAVSIMSRRENVTLVMSLLAAFYVLLYRWTGQDDMVLGMPVANRNQKELEALIGFFVNTLALRARLISNQPFQKLLMQVRETALQGYIHQDLPFEKLVEDLQPDRDLGRTPLFQVMFVLQNAEEEELQLPGVKLQAIEVGTGTAKFDLTLIIAEQNGDLACGWEYNTDLFEQDTIRRMGASYCRLLQDIISNPGRQLSELEALSEAERQQLLSDWNCTNRDFKDFGKNLVEILDQAVTRYPIKSAVIFEGHSFSYRDLDRRSNQLAHYLQRLGIGPESRVGICLERSIDMVVALVGTLKAGGAYVPLDPSYPLERLKYMAEDAEVRVLLTHSHLLGTLAELIQAEKICLDSENSNIATESAGPVSSGLDPGNLAYVIYTSGSTGNPKGAMVSHEAICNRLLWMQSQYQLSPEDRVLQKTPFSFDVSVWEFFWTLITGASLVVARPGGHHDPTYLCELIKKEEITILHFVPSMLQALLDDENSSTLWSLRHIICSGEALSVELKNRCLARIPAQLHNLYGPTEAAVDVTAWRCKPEDSIVPIGKPIANIQMHILDSHYSPVPVGVHGELYIAGIGLGRGYVGRGDLTAERFLPNPFGEPGSRMYRTGDSARYLPEGSIEFLGRRDDQIKIRGFRIELAEISAWMKKHPRVADAAVIVREDKPTERRLVGYVVPRDPDTETLTSELRAFLKEKLPEYMVPWHFLFIDSLPLTRSGKVDRKSLPQPDFAQRTQEFSAPTTIMEAVLAGIWQEVLGVPRVGVYDNFFQLGGDSIRSIQVTARAKKRGLNLSLQEIFRYQTIAELARLPELNAVVAPFPQIKPFQLVINRDLEAMPEGVEDAYPLTSMQAGMIYHMRLTPESPVYHNVDSVYLQAPWDYEAFWQAVQAATDRHPNLRTSFDLSRYSEPLQLVHASVKAALGFTDIEDLSDEEQQRAVNAFIATEQQPSRFFDLARPPLLRFHVHKRGEDRFQLTITENHAIQDGWSLHSTLEEIFSNYLGVLKHGRIPERPLLQVKYSDFVYLEKKAIADDACQEYWRSKLSDYNALRVVEPRRETQTVAQERSHWVEVSRHISDGLKDLAAKAAVPLKSVLLATHLKVLSFLSGQTDVVSGMTTNGRQEDGDAAEVRGLFLNTIPFRITLGSESWHDLVKDVFQKEWEMLPYRRYPLSEIQNNWGHEGIVDVNFLYTHFHVVKGLLRSEEVKVLGYDSKGPTNLALVSHFFLDWEDLNIRLNLVYNTGRLSQAQVERIAGYFLKTLEAMVQTPLASHQTIALLSPEEEYQLLVEWNPMVPELVSYRTIHQMVEEHAAENPDATAIILDGQILTYGDLNFQANQLARYLRNCGVDRDVPVGIYLERSVEMVVALLGVLKAGGAYVPLSPQYPQQRISYVTEDAQLPIILTLERLHQTLPASFAQEICLDSLRNEIAAESGEGINSNVDPQNLAYVIYTSGSTGRPKGVMIPHHGVVNYLNWCRREYKIQDGCGALVHSPLEFDLTVTSLWGPLCAGKTVHLVSEKEGVEGLGKELVYKQGLSLIKLTPAHLDVLQHTIAGKQIVGSTNAIVIGGEALTLDRLEFWQQHAPETRLINEYGPTETVVGCSIYEVTPGQAFAGTVPIGRPISNTKIYILNTQMQLAPIGMIGEICVQGAGIGRGYLGHPDLTAERYVPNPYATCDGDRLYRTGDLGRYLESGDLECLGRIDQQIKIRGYRIELGEIENILKEHEQIKDAVVIVREETEADRQLVAFFVTEEHRAVDIQQVRDCVRQKLPEYMAPATYIQIGDLPLTSNGKVDRRALAVSKISPQNSRKAERARFGTESVILRIWQDVLAVSEIGINDNFFELGGHSLTALRVIAQIREHCGVDLPPSIFWEAGTVKALTNVVLVMIANAPSPNRHLVAMRTTGKNPPLFFVHPVGGNVFSFNALVRHLGPDQPFYALQSVDVDDPKSTIQAMAAEYLSEIQQLQPEGPYMLGGWSFGGAMAFEMAQQLRARGQEVSLLAIVDRDAPQGTEPEIDPISLTRHIEDIYRLQEPLSIDEAHLLTLDHEEQLLYIMEQAHLAGVVPDGIEPARSLKLLRNLRDRINANRRYVPSVYPGPVTLFWHYVESDTNSPWTGDADHGWAVLSTQPLEIYSIPGSHWGMMEEPYVAVLAEKLAACVVRSVAVFK